MVRLFVILSAVPPRLALLALWFMTPLISGAFGLSAWMLFVPMLSLACVPFTVLSYVLVTGLPGPTPLWGWLIVLLSVVVDWRSTSAVVVMLEPILCVKEDSVGNVQDSTRVHGAHMCAIGRHASVPEHEAREQSRSK